MNRRVVLAALLGIPLGALGQIKGRTPKIGVLAFTTTTSSYQESLRRGLRQFGYIEGKNIQLEWRSAEGSFERAEKLAIELVAMNVDVIVAFLTPAVQAAKKATRTVPIVMAYSGDPVGTGLVKSLARPEGNVTGLSSTSAEISGKRIELLRELIPEISHIGVLINGADSFAKPFAQENLAAARRIGVAIDVVDVRDAPNLNAAFARLKKARAGAVIVQGSLVAPWSEAAIKHQMPTMATQRRAAAAGALMYFGADPDELTVRAASFIDRLLKGAKPGDLPIEQPTRMELVLNRRTAKALGIVIPPPFLVRADAVID